MSPGLVVGWLVISALPCADVGRELERLSELAARDPEALDGALAQLEVHWEGVPLREGTSSAPVQRLETARHRLQRLCAARDAAVRTAPAARESDPARLAAILSRPEFAHARQRQGDALERLLRLAKDWLEGLLQTREAQGFATSTRLVVLVLGFAVVLFALLRLRHWKSSPTSRRPESEGTRPAALPLDSPGEHLGRARAALATQPRTAIREGLLALLSSLESRRLARPDRVRTNRELVEELPGRGASPQVTGEVERLVGWYDRTFYSLQPVPEGEATRFVDEVERLHQGLAGGAA